MMYCIQKEGIFRPFVPERDTFRIIKFGTCDLLKLDDLDPEIDGVVKFSEEELELIAWWYMEFSGETE